MAPRAEPPAVPENLTDANARGAAGSGRPDVPGVEVPGTERPVYFFIADAKPGDVNGQGINGAWFAVSPAGGRTKAIPGFP